MTTLEKARQLVAILEEHERRENQMTDTQKTGRMMEYVLNEAYRRMVEHERKMMQTA